MQKQITLGNISYDLYQTSLTNIAEEYLSDSLHQNDGLDYFLGSDCVSVYAYLIEKNKVSQFVTEINNFIEQAEKMAIPKNSDDDFLYLESIEDFGFIHKRIENSEYDIFISNFETPMIRENYDETVQVHDEFMKNIQKLAIFSIEAGSTYNDDSILDFITSYLYSHYKNQLLKIIDQDTIEHYIGQDYEDFSFISKDEDVTIRFIKYYLEILPETSKDNDFLIKIKHCLSTI